MKNFRNKSLFLAVLSAFVLTGCQVLSPTEPETKSTGSVETQTPNVVDPAINAPEARVREMDNGVIVIKQADERVPRDGLTFRVDSLNEEFTLELSELSSKDTGKELLDSVDYSVREKRVRISETIDTKEREALGAQAEIDRMMDLLDEQDSLSDELKDIRKQIKEYNEKNTEYFRKFNDEINELIADKLEALLAKFDKAKFLKNYDVVDMRIATNISKYYEMAMLGERASKIQETIRKDAEMISGRAEQLTRR